MLRKLLIGFFILTSLTGQAATAFACSMTGTLVMHHCCCHGRGTAKGASAGESCCTQIALIGEAAGAVQAARTAIDRWLPDFPPALTSSPVVAAASLDFRVPMERFGPPPGSLSRSGSLTYLRTHRLRI